jgi:DNA-binding MarR family transcriptional regulator
MDSNPPLPNVDLQPAESIGETSDEQRLFMLQVLRWVDNYERSIFGRLVDRQTMEILRFLGERHLQRRDVFVQDIVTFTGGYYISASKKLSAFEERGLLHREKDTIDGRRTRVVVSEKFSAMLRTYLDTLQRLTEMYRYLESNATSDPSGETGELEFDEISKRFARAKRKLK